MRGLSTTAGHNEGEANPMESVSQPSASLYGDTVCFSLRDYQNRLVWQSDAVFPSINRMGFGGKQAIGKDAKKTKRGQRK